MPSNRGRRNKRGLPGAFLIMGILSLIYGGAFPLYRLLHYAFLGILMAVAGSLYRYFIKQKYRKEDEEAERQAIEQERRQQLEREKKEAEERAKAEKAKVNTGNKEVDALILKGQQMLQHIREENIRLPDPEITAQIDEIERVANQIFVTVMDQPSKAPQIRRFMEYYLPTTLKMLTSYRRMEESNVRGQNALQAKQKIRTSLDLVIEAFHKQLSQLYEDDALDISTDIDVMETMLKQDGLLESGLKVRTSTGEEKDNG